MSRPTHWRCWQGFGRAEEAYLLRTRREKGGRVAAAEGSPLGDDAADSSEGRWQWTRWGSQRVVAWLAPCAVFWRTLPLKCGRRRRQRRASTRRFRYGPPLAGTDGAGAGGRVWGHGNSGYANRGRVAGLRLRSSGVPPCTSRTGSAVRRCPGRPRTDKLPWECCSSIAGALTFVPTEWTPAPGRHSSTRQAMSRWFASCRAREIRRRTRM